jgi:hypothetical protein
MLPDVTFVPYAPQMITEPVLIFLMIMKVALKSASFHFYFFENPFIFRNSGEKYSIIYWGLPGGGDDSGEDGAV